MPPIARFCQSGDMSRLAGVELELALRNKVSTMIGSLMQYVRAEEWGTEACQTLPNRERFDEVIESAIMLLGKVEGVQAPRRPQFLASDPTKPLLSFLDLCRERLRVLIDQSKSTLARFNPQRRAEDLAGWLVFKMPAGYDMDSRVYDFDVDWLDTRCRNSLYAFHSDYEQRSSRRLSTREWNLMVEELRQSLTFRHLFAGGQFSESGRSVSIDMRARCKKVRGVGNLSCDRIVKWLRNQGF